MSVSIEEISKIRILAGLAPEELAAVAGRIEACDFLAGRVILSREDPADTLFFLLQGSVRVELRCESGQVCNLGELTDGAIFGERGLLTGEARTADIRAISDVRVGRLGRADFAELLAQAPQISVNLCRELAGQLGTWAQRYRREEGENREVLAHVVGWQLLPEFADFPGNSPWVRELNARLQHLGTRDRHVLIQGEAGTWKDLAARLIHYHAGAGRPVLFLDCAAPPPILPAGKGPADVRDPLYLEIGQEAALFGLAADGAIYARRARRGMLELAAGGDMILRNVDNLTPALQEKLLAFLGSGRFRRRGESQWREARVRVIATSGNDLAGAVAAGDFSAGLFALLAAERVEMLPLRERKKDIPVIARSLLRTLNAKHHKAVRRLSQEAMNRLVDHDWPLNGSELYQVLSRAVVVCDGDRIHAEHIFLQGQPFGDGRFNLLTLPAIDQLARRPDFPRVLRYSTVPLFLLVTVATLTGSTGAAAANLAVWSLWWPALFLTAFFFARGWCSYCPLEAIGERLGKKTGVVHEPKPWLRRWGPSLSLAGLVIIVLLEQATGMFLRPVATGILLLSLLAATVTADFVLGRRGWCKYLCPLGRIVSLFSRISLLEMRSNPNVCVSRCRVDDCVRERGCPMGLHPTGIDNSDHCVLCLNCVRSCPHHAMQLDLRNPAWGLFNRARRGFSEALFSVALVGAVLAAKGTPLLFGRAVEVFPQRLWSGEEIATAAALVLIYVALALLASGGRRFSRWRSTFTICGLAYLPLAFAGLFAVYFRVLIDGGAAIVPLSLTALGLHRIVPLAAVTPDFATLRLLPAPLLLGGSIFSWAVLGRLQQQYALGRGVLLGHRSLVLLTALLFLLLL